MTTLTADIINSWADNPNGPVALHLKQKLLPVEGDSADLRNRGGQIALQYRHALGRHESLHHRQRRQPGQPHGADLQGCGT
jgi:hypothetical protein